MNIYEKIGLKRVINASGKMTYLGVSAISDDVAAAAKEAAQNYVVIDNLIDAAGKIISKHTGAQDSCVTSCASAAIAMSIAGLVTNGDLNATQNIHKTYFEKNQVIIQKGHAIDFGAPISAMIEMGGGEVVEVGYSNATLIEHVEGAINENTVALVYAQSHHAVQKSMVSLADMIKIAHDNNLPILVDAAAEDDLKKYIAMGADLVVYSGAKAIEATTSGFVTGKEDYIKNIKKQYKGIGRAMKVGKEGIIGLLVALEAYEKIDTNEKYENEKTKTQFMVDEINKIKGFEAKITFDEAGRKICRAEVKVDKNLLGVDAKRVEAMLADCNPAIHIRKHKVNLGYLTFDPRPLGNGDEKIIVDSMKSISEECLNGK